MQGIFAENASFDSIRCAKAAELGWFVEGRRSAGPLSSLPNSQKVREVLFTPDLTRQVAHGAIRSPPPHICKPWSSSLESPRWRFAEMAKCVSFVVEPTLSR